ncbi:MAG: WG repeat-containing protein [Muribaculaceae bacterium]|nr:WG repeat-containing protein [Muribaculaceae bacterium]
MSLEGDGHWIAEPRFIQIFYHFDGLDRVQFENGKWGWINENGKWIIDPIFDEAEPFTTDGTAKVKIDGKSRIINLHGKYVDKFD